MRTAEEDRQHYIAVMGEELGSVYYSLRHEVIWLSHMWGEYEELFAKKSRVELINQAATAFFYMVETTLREQVILHIARLTDHPESFGKQNLTIRRLSPLITNSSAKQRVETLTEKALEAANFCRDWRNRWIAHSDLDLSLDRPVEPLAPATRGKVGDALAAIADVLNAVEHVYMDTTTIFKPVLTSGAVALLYVIDDGLRRDRERQERLRRGELNTDDLRNRDL